MAISNSASALRPDTASTSSPNRRVIELLFLLAFPLLVFFVLHLQPINQKSMLDPYIYTGYINNFGDLFPRYGLTYYGVRFGLILPAKLLASIFGADGGYFVFRYLLALTFGIPLYLLIKSYLSSTTAVVIYACSLGSPYFARALLWDHPDASGVPFLTAAICTVMLGQRRRKLWDFVAGCFAAMAIHSNVFTGAILLLFGAVYCCVWIRHKRGPGILVERTLSVSIGVTFITIAGMVYYSYVGHRPLNILFPTINTALALSQGGMKDWRVPGTDWTATLFHVFVPVWLSICFLAAYGFRRNTFTIAVMGWYGIVVTAFYYLHQFVLNADTLQLFYYFSYAIPAVFFLLAVLTNYLWERAGVSSGLFVTIVLLAMLGPWLLATFGITLFIAKNLRVFLVLSSLTLLVIAAVRMMHSGALARRSALLALLLLGIAIDSGFSNYSGIVRPWKSSDHSEMDVYHVALQLTRVVPKLSDPRGHILFWYNNRLQNPINSVQSTYLWGYSKINHNPPQDPGLPVLSDEQTARLRDSGDVRYLGLLCESGGELRQGLEALKAHGIAFRELDRRELKSGAYGIVWELVQLQRP